MIKIRVLIGQIQHETNTFCNIKATMKHFQKLEWEQGNQIIKKHKGTNSFLGGIIDKSEELSLDLVPTFSANGHPSGIITSESYKNMRQKLLSYIKNSENFDAICIVLHGAGVSEDTDDIEGDILQEIRWVVGYDLPIVATLDLHGNITDKMIQEADILLPVNLYPHIDYYERGAEAISITEQMVNGRLKPSMFLKKMPLMIPTFTTNQSPAKEINEECWEWEKERDVVECSFIHGFPYADTPNVSSSVLTITNNNNTLARSIAEDVSAKVWKLKSGFFKKIITPDEGLNKAKNIKSKPIIINETSDNPGAGTPGDGTYLLRKMIELKVNNACFASICDPDTVEKASSIGVGNSIEIELGAKTDSFHGNPIQINTYIKTLSDGKLIMSSPMERGSKVDFGPTARLNVNGIDILVSSINQQIMDNQLFLLNGINIDEYKIVAIKSSQHFRAYFESVSSNIITVNSQGLSSLNLYDFNYKNIKRPIYPLDSFC